MSQDLSTNLPIPVCSTTSNDQLCEIIFRQDLRPGDTMLRVPSQLLLATLGPDTPSELQPIVVAARGNSILPEKPSASLNQDVGSQNIESHDYATRGSSSKRKGKAKLTTMSGAPSIPRDSNHSLSLSLSIVPPDSTHPSTPYAPMSISPITPVSPATPMPSPFPSLNPTPRAPRTPGPLYLSSLSAASKTPTYISPTMDVSTPETGGTKRARSPIRSSNVGDPAYLPPTLEVSSLETRREKRARSPVKTSIGGGEQGKKRKVEGNGEEQAPLDRIRKSSRKGKGKGKRRGE